MLNGVRAGSENGDPGRQGEGPTPPGDLRVPATELQSVPRVTVLFACHSPEGSERRGRGVLPLEVSSERGDPVRGGEPRGAAFQTCSMPRGGLGVAAGDPWPSSEKSVDFSLSAFRTAFSHSGQ